MPKFRKKKPDVIEACQWRKHGDSTEVWFYCHYDPDVANDVQCSECGLALRHHGQVNAQGAIFRVCPGDWIITDMAGERYFCKPDIFAATYEPAE